MCPHMYGLSMKPEYENWCNCCVVSLLPPWVTPGPALYLVFCSVTLPPPSPPPLLHTHLLSVGSFAVFFLPPLVSPALSPSLSVLQCFTPSIPHSHRGLIYFHYWVKRRAFVCHQQRSHGAMLGVTARVTNLLPSLTSMLACAWNLLNVGGKNRVCVRVCVRVRKFLHPCLLQSLFLWIIFNLYFIVSPLAAWVTKPLHPSTLTP